MATDAAGWAMGRRDAITDIPGIRVGHWTDRRGATGCTVVLCDGCDGTAVDARGGAPGTRETEVLGMANAVRRADAVVLCGGSAFGLAAATGVMRWCREQGIGVETTAARVPIVSGAVVFDLGAGRADAFPDDAAGYAAVAAARAGAVAQGSVGAGTGTTVAKLLGNEGRLKGGVGTASVAGPRGLIAGALVVTNAVGSIVDPDTGALVAGPVADGRMLPLAEVIARRREQMEALLAARPAENTTLCVVATNAMLDHRQLQRLAYQAHDGLARAIVPCHTFGDGDIAFAIGMGGVEPAADDALLVGALVVRAVERAVVKGVRAARSVAGIRVATA
jgi:L-aminopeptidase/D-esterase-like protein